VLVIDMKMRDIILGRLPMTNTSVVVCAINRIVSLHRHLLGSAPELATSTFIVSTRRRRRSYHQSPRVSPLHSFIATLYYIYYQLGINMQKKKKKFIKLRCCCNLSPANTFLFVLVVMNGKPLDDEFLNGL
jgi:hypothetical protein